MAYKNRQDFERELCEMRRKDDIENCLKEERKVSDESYAPMIIKTIVYVAIGAICLAFINYYAQSIWK
jgi:hypothetical protein